MGAGVRREPHHRHDRSQARLGDLAPARLGRADRRVRARRAAARCWSTTRSTQRIYDAMYAEGADAWFADADGARFLKPDYDPADVREGQRRARRLVRFRLARTAYVAGRSEHFPSLAGIERQVDGGRDRVMYLEGSDQHRGWFHSSLIESLRHARPRAVRRRADARLLPRREGAEDVEVGRQRDGAAGRHQEFRRRHPAPVGRRVRLFRRSAHRPGDPEELRRDLSQDAQHAALDARHARPLRAGAASGGRRHAGAGAATCCTGSPSSTCIVRKAYADYDYKRVVSMLVAVHEHGAVGLLLRHPQGRALLRRAIEPAPPRGAHRASSTSSAA